MKKPLVTALVAAAALLGAGAANAAGHVSWSIGINTPFVGSVVSNGPLYAPIYAPAPVYAPAPMYAPVPMYAPAPVYRSAPRVYDPAPVYVYDEPVRVYDGWREPAYAPRTVYHRPIEARRDGRRHGDHDARRDHGRGADHGRVEHGRVGDPRDWRNDYIGND